MFIDRDRKETTAHSTDQTKNLDPGQQHAFRVKTTYRAHVVNADATHFHRGSAVLLPVPASRTATDDRSGKTVTGLSILATCYRHCRQQPEQTLLVVGRAQEREAADPQGLSTRRAEHVQHLLQGHRRDWAEGADAHHGTADVQRILRWQAAYGWGCDPGPIDGEPGSKTARVLQGFQRRYNEHVGRSIPEDGRDGRETWGAVFDVYMMEVRRILGTDDEELDAIQTALTFLPCSAIGEAGDAPGTAGQGTGRGVEVFSFGPGEEPPVDRAAPRVVHEALGRYTRTPIAPEPTSPPAPSAPPNDIRMTGLEAAHFVPGRETIDIAYEIDGPLYRVQSLRVVIRKAASGARILNQSVPVSTQRTGTYTWDGHVTDDDFDEVANLKEAPYEVQLILHEQSGATRKSNAKQIEVVADKVEIFVENPGLSDLDSREESIIEEVKEEVGKKGQKVRVVYESSVCDDRVGNTDSGKWYEKYKNVWGEGARIPLYARIWLLGKKGTRKYAEKATANTRVLWDVRLETDSEYEESLNERGVHEKAKAFLKRVSGYEEADTAPRGRTAHKHFGGMRARADQRTDAETQWQELQADWPLESPSNRPWATYTTCATVEADVKAQTGVFFRGGRMAGDVHHVTAYVETGTSLDTEDALGGLPAEQTSNTFRFENWRRVEIEGHWKVGPNATDLDLKALNAEYNKAAMEIVPTSNMTKENAREKWLKIIKAAIKYRKKNNLFTRNAVKGTSDKHLVGFKKYEKYRGSSLFDFSEKNSEKG